MTGLPTAADGLLLALIAVGLPLRSWFAMRQLRSADAARLTALRPALWYRAVLTQWLMVSGVAVQWIALGRHARDLGLAPEPTWGLGGVLLGTLVVSVMAIAQRRQIRERPEIAERIRARLAPVESLMPHARAEWPRFAGLAITAGVCEEVMFRGFVTWCFSHLLPTYAMACAAQIALFGLAHAYQGPRGVFATAAVGAFLTGVVWISGSLWPAMLLHALMDLNAGDLAIRVYAPRGTVGESGGRS